MQQTMGNSKLLNSIVIFTICVLLFTGCNPREPKLELKLKEQAIGKAFTFADFCENKYDSIALRRRRCHIFPAIQNVK